MVELDDAYVAGEHRLERRDAAENRQRVLDVAQRLFAEQGVQAVSMHQIAQAACVGQGTLYRRYGHKGELCLDLMHESGKRLWEKIESIRSSHDGSDALRRLESVLQHLVSFIEEKASMLGAISEACSGDRRSGKYDSDFYRSMHGTITGLLDEAVAAGQLPPFDTVFTADAIIATFNPDLYLFQRQDRGMTQEQILAGLRRIYIEGLHSA